MKLYKVSGFLDKSGFGKRIYEMQVEETANSYVGEGHRISKDKLMKVDKIFIENHLIIKYHTYCLDGQQQDALDLLKSHIIKKATQYKAEIDLLMGFIN